MPPATGMVRFSPETTPAVSESARPRGCPTANTSSPICTPPPRTAGTMTLGSGVGHEDGDVVVGLLGDDRGRRLGAVGEGDLDRRRVRNDVAGRQDLALASTMTPAPDAVSSGNDPFGVELMNTTEGWITLNTVSPAGGTFSAASTPLATSDVMVLSICSGVSVDGRSLDRIRATDASTIANATPAASSQDFVGHDFGGRSRPGCSSSVPAGVSTRYSSKTRTSGCYCGGRVPSPRPASTCAAGGFGLVTD